MRALEWVIRHLPGGHLTITPTDQAFAKLWPTTRRGLKLWGLSALFLVRGLQWIVAPNPTMHDALRTFDWMPLQVMGGVMVVAALYAAWMAYCHHGRDLYGYVTLSALAALITFAYLASLLFLDAPGYAWGAVTAWGITVWLVYVMAGDPDPSIEDGRLCVR